MNAHEHFAETVARAAAKSGRSLIATASAPVILYCPKCQRRAEHRDVRMGGVVYSTCQTCGHETTMSAGA